MTYFEGFIVPVPEANKDAYRQHAAQAAPLFLDIGVKRHFEGICYGGVERFELPNLGALNFLLHQSLGGGGTVSLKTDAQGKTYSSALLRMGIDVDDETARLVEG